MKAITTVSLIVATASAAAIRADSPFPASPEPPAVVARDAEGRVTVRAVRLAESLVLDGVLSDPIYERVRPISGFLQQDPLEGEPSTETTEAWVLFDDDAIYVAARLGDSHPERMVANEMRRDHFNISRGESFTVVLDTFLDRRNGFYFETNPLGAVRDGLVTDESDLNTDWNTAWNVRTSRSSEGWSVEMTIPFKSLRYREAAAATWGLQLKRQIQWKNEDSFLTLVPRSWQWRGVRKLSSAATLVGLEIPAGGGSSRSSPTASGGSTPCSATRRSSRTSSAPTPDSTPSSVSPADSRRTSPSTPTSPRSKRTSSR